MMDEKKNFQFPISNFQLLRGQSLFEVLVTVGVLALIMVGVVSLAATSVRNTTFSRNKTQATRYAQGATEWLREERDTSWDDYLNDVQASNTYCLDYTSWSTTGVCGLTETIGGNTIFRREVSFNCFKTNPLAPTPPPFISADCSTDPDVDNVEAIVKVEWNDAQGNHEVRNVVRLTKWNI